MRLASTVVRSSVRRAWRARRASSVALAAVMLAFAIALLGAVARGFAAAAPPGKKITAFSKDASGGTSNVPIVPMTCQGQVTEQITNLTIRVTLSSGPCDEGFSKARLNGSFLATVSVTRRRGDNRGCFRGTWRLLGQSGVTASGTLNGTVGAGTHRPPLMGQCENCSSPKHYEGSMVGRIQAPGEFNGAQICATLAGMGPLQPPLPQKIAFEGAVISNCPK